jgi:hypothetical protein
MGKKEKTTRLMSEFRASAATPPRREPTRPAGLYLLELRNHAGNTLPRRKLVISIATEENLPKPVKIIHSRT